MIGIRSVKNPGGGYSLMLVLGNTSIDLRYQARSKRHAAAIRRMLLKKVRKSDATLRVNAMRHIAVLFNLE